MRGGRLATAAMPQVMIFIISLQDRLGNLSLWYEVEQAMRYFQCAKDAVRSCVLCLAAGLGVLPAVSSVQAVTSEQGDIAFNSLNKVYWDSATGFFRKEEHGSRKADFWFSAQLWDTVMDQYDRTGGAEVKRQINEVYEGFIKEYPDWTTNKYNDDVTWWAVACSRAYKITNDERYLKKAKVSFDFVYDNFVDDAVKAAEWTRGNIRRVHCTHIIVSRISGQCIRRQVEV
jgi:hypothetical protein